MFSRRIFFFAEECIWKAPSRAKFSRNQIYRGKHTRKSYGARYLDPKYSRWISTDPALGEYIPAAGKANAKDMANLPGMGGFFNHTNADLYHYAGNNPVRYIDPDGKWFLFDDMLFSFILKLVGKQDCTWWQGTIDSFVHSWKHPFEHGINFYELYLLFFEWADSKFGLESYNKLHVYPNQNTEAGIVVDIFKKNMTVFFKTKEKRQCEVDPLDLSKIQERKNDEK